jgi:hypothetical protein
VGIQTKKGEARERLEGKKGQLREVLILHTEEPELKALGSLGRTAYR